MTDLVQVPAVQRHDGPDGPLFLAVLVLGLVFEGGRVLWRGTNACTKPGAARR